MAHTCETPAASAASDYPLSEAEQRLTDIAYRIAFLRLTEWRLRAELEFYDREIRRLKLEEL